MCFSIFGKKPRSFAKIIHCFALLSLSGEHLSQLQDSSPSWGSNLTAAAKISAASSRWLVTAKIVPSFIRVPLRSGAKSNTFRKC